MVRKVVTVDEGLHLPPAVQTQLKADLDTEFADYVTDAQTAASDASLSVVAAQSARDTAVSAATAAGVSEANIEATLATWAIDTSDVGISSVILDTGSDTRGLLDSTYLPRLGAAGQGVPRVFNVSDYGAVGDNSADDTPAIQAAISAASVSGGLVFLPRGVYRTTGPLVISAPNVAIVGVGRTATRIVNALTTGNVFEVALTATRCTIASMTIDRQTIATAGAGIYAYSESGRGNHMDFHDLYVYNQFRGIYLGPQSWGEVRNVIVDQCNGDGIFITNNSDNGACQWQLTNILVQKVGGHGYWVYSQTTGPTQITLGQWTNVASFACTGAGIYMQGRAGRPIHDARISGGFIGEDGCTAGAEIVLDTYGGSHLFTGMFIELAGSRTTGPSFATAASGLGHGIYATPNNTDWTMAGAHIVANARSGIYNEAARATLNGLTMRSNGTNATVGAADNSGIYWAAGRGVIHGQSWSQEIGVYGAVNTLFGLVDCTGSTTGYSGVTRSANLVIV